MPRRSYSICSVRIAIIVCTQWNCNFSALMRLVTLRIHFPQEKKLSTASAHIPLHLHISFFPQCIFFNINTIMLSIVQCRRTFLRPSRVVSILRNAFGCQIIQNVSSMRLAVLIMQSGRQRSCNTWPTSTVELVWNQGRWTPYSRTVTIRNGPSVVSLTLKDILNITQI